ncbi:uncharacterized protein LOC126894920 isoform X7 [Daktulosphaira vitifoliae]|uniref:uncharacterized protein LOC126894920 isoform X7 n=1 Tax=Daktulosphaira vitifoliae TaxID=58002 RepID=UPI0021AAD59B|nr:uncharacterized protein LOC126894920 isoform X7 [Daktulosphaira vitifoliae]XP_050522241.1 uncharacterized protein LOC126894920 isoform X7 [Daktulosphaira vitifoliae]
MYLQFQIILCVGLIFSSSADTTFNDVFDALTSKNLDMAQYKFHKCVDKYQINALQAEKDNINTQLTTLKNKIVSGEIKLNQTSTTILELLELDTSHNSNNLKRCCAIFHKNLFAVEKPKFTSNDHMEVLTVLRFDTAFNILHDCLHKYNCSKISKEDLLWGFFNRDPNSRNDEPDLKSSTHQLLEIVVHNNSPNYFVNTIKNYIYGPNCKIPFAGYCAAAYYTYLITESPNLNNIFKEIRQLKS